MPMSQRHAAKQVLTACAVRCPLPSAAAPSLGLTFSKQPLNFYCSPFPTLLTCWLLHLQALEAIHAAGYLHGDVRCDNLIYEDNSGKVNALAAGLPLNARRLAVAAHVIGQPAHPAT